jgi:predicted alpha/beta superfamily hydrolase
MLLLNNRLLVLQYRCLKLWSMLWHRSSLLNISPSTVSDTHLEIGMAIGIINNQQMSPTDNDAHIAKAAETNALENVTDEIAKAVETNNNEQQSFMVCDAHPEIVKAVIIMTLVINLPSVITWLLTT